MLDEFVRRFAARSGLCRPVAEKVAGLILNASDRQGGHLARVLFSEVPGARTLAARAGAEAGAATGVIARMIERTPGGRIAVREQLIRTLHACGLGHAGVAGALVAFEGALRDLSISAAGLHLGDLFGGGGQPSQAGNGRMARVARMAD